MKQVELRDQYHSQLMNSFILKNLYQVKNETHMNKKKLNINLVQHL
jgi:hypothetical protein